MKDIENKLEKLNNELNIILHDIDIIVEKMNIAKLENNYDILYGLEYDYNILKANKLDINWKIDKLNDTIKILKGE